eukprot:12928626-Prorocentrum_lima.AAC.1
MLDGIHTLAKIDDALHSFDYKCSSISLRWDDSTSRFQQFKFGTKLDHVNGQVSWWFAVDGIKRRKDTSTLYSTQ